MSRAVPSSLRRWFVVHFVADVVVAIPLFVAPRAALELLGWTSIDPLATRLVAAALFGIGIESLLGRNAGVEAFRAMLNLKIVWSAAATLGILWSQLEGGPPMGRTETAPRELGVEIRPEIDRQVVRARLHQQHPPLSLAPRPFEPAGPHEGAASMWPRTPLPCCPPPKPRRGIRHARSRG